MPLGAFRLNSLSRFEAPTAARPRTVTPTNVTVSTTQSKFGGASAFFNSSTSSLGITPFTEFAFGTANFTIEAHIYLTDTSVYRTIWNSNNTNQSLNFYVQTNRSLNFFTSAAGQVGSNSNVIPLNTWTHVALTRSSGTTRGFVNGGQVLTSSTSYNSTDAISARVGYDGANAWAGYIDEVRVSSTARYTAGFTAPTAAFTNDANTLLLLHCNGTNGSTSFPDDNA
jgi:hypothetical protein